MEKQILEKEHDDQNVNWAEPISNDEVEEGGQEDYQTKAYQLWVKLQEEEEQ